MSLLVLETDVASSLYDVPMPFAVFFDTDGRALHQGSLHTESAGCVRLPRAAAKIFFEALEPSDIVQIVP